MNSISNRSLFVLSWNTHGLGDSDKCNLVHDAIRTANPSVTCLQETKLHEISSFKAKTFLPLNLADHYLFNAADGSL